MAHGPIGSLPFLPPLHDLQVSCSQTGIQVESDHLDARLPVRSPSTRIVALPVESSSEDGCFVLMWEYLQSSLGSTDEIRGVFVVEL